jgi:SagB-type dehydrogenase family enzyme
VVASSKDKSIGASFHAQTKYRRGQLPSVTAPVVPPFKVYANPLEVVTLPVPDVGGGKGLWSVLATTREHIPEGGRLRQKQVSQILWAANGFTYGGQQRTHVAVQDLGAIETYLVVNSVQDMFPGLYHYDPREHALEHIVGGNLSEQLAAALLARFEFDAHAAALAFTGLPGRLEPSTRSRAYRHLYGEANAAAQCAVLAGVGLDLVATYHADFYDDEMARLLQVDGSSEVPLALVLLGR